MKNGFPFRVLRSFATLVFAVATGGATALAQTHTWDGGSATTNNWSDSGNWDAVGVPAQPGAGVANIVFGGLARPTPSLQAAYDVNSIAFNNTAGAFTLGGGGPLTLRGGGVTNNDADLQTFNVPLTLNAAQVWSAISGALATGNLGTLNLGGNQLSLSGSNGFTFAATISGAGGSIVKNGAGTTTFSGPANTYTGATTVNAGTLLLSKSAGVNALAGNLTIGDGTGGPLADIVQLGAASQVADSATVTINSSGLLNLNNNSETIGTLTLSGGSVSAGAGTLTLAGTLTASAASTATSSVSGNFNLGGTRSFSVGDGTAVIDLDISAVISSGSIDFIGAGGISRLSGANTFFGGVTLNTSHTLLIGHDQALGLGGTFTVNGGAMRSDGGPRSVANPVSLAGNLTIGGTQTLTFGGAMTLTGNRTLDVTNTAATTLSGAIDESGASRSFTKNGTGTLIFSGGSANTYTGPTTLNGGVLLLQKNFGITAVPGNLVVGDGVGGVLADVVRLGSNDQIADTAAVTVNASGLLDLNDFSESIGSLSFAGGTASANGGTLTLGGSVTSSNLATSQAFITGNLNLGAADRVFEIQNGSAAIDLDVIGSILGAGSGLIKDGNGTLRFSGAAANSYTGTTTVNNGALELNHSAGTNGAVVGSLVVGDGIATARVNIVAAEQIADSASIAVNANATLTFDHIAETIGPLTFNGGSVAITTGGSLTLTSDVATLGNSQPATIGSGQNQTLNLGGVARSFDVAEGEAATDLEISEVISNGSLVKNGAGTLRLSGSVSSTLSGVTLNAGTLILAKSSSFNAVTGNVTVGDGAGGADADVLRLGQNQQIAQLVTETLTVNSSGLFDLGGFSEGLGNLLLNAGHVAGGTISFTGSVASSAQTATATIDAAIDLLGSTTTFAVGNGAAADDLVLSGILQNGSFQKSGAGTLRLTGSGANTASLQQISAGTLVLDKTGGVNALGGTSLIIGDGVGNPLANVVRYGANDNQLPDTMTVTVQQSGLLDLNGRSDTIGTLAMVGSGGVETGTGTLTVSSLVSSDVVTSAGTINGKLSLGGDTLPFSIGDGTAGVDLTVTAAMSNGTLAKQGTGTLALAGAALSSAISYQLDGGTLSAGGLVIGSARAFTHNAGTFAGQLTNHGTFTYNGGMFSGGLTSDGSLVFNADFMSGNGLTNQGEMSVPAGQTLTLDGAGLLNAPTGSISMDGGTLAGNGPVVNQGLLTGLGTLAGAAGFSNSGQVIVSGGTLALNNTGANLNTGAIGVGLSQSFAVTTSLTNAGLLLLAGGTTAGPGTLTNAAGGEIRGIGGVQASLINNGGLIHATGTGILTIANLGGGNVSGGELRADDGATLNVANAFSSSGTIVLVGANAQLTGGAVTNTGTTRGLGRIANVVANSGTLRAESGTLTLSAAGNTNAAGGRIEAGIGTQILYSHGLAANNGQIVLSGGAFDNNNVALANPGLIEGFGTLRTGGLTNTGAIDVGGSLDVFGVIMNNSLVNTHSGATARFFGPVNGPGNYTGAGTTMFLNSFSPGASPAQITFGGNLVFGGGANLVLELAGTTPGTQFDRLNVAGSATLAGALNVSLLSGFTPVFGNSFQILSATGGVTGTFNSVTFPALGGGLGWNILYGGNAVTLQVLSTAVPGDYNNNGTVDAADYILWRNGGPLQNEVHNPGTVTTQDYTEWRTRFGNTSGTGASQPISAAVPESTTWLLSAFALAALTFSRDAKRNANT